MSSGIALSFKVDLFIYLFLKGVNRRASIKLHGWVFMLDRSVGGSDTSFRYEFSRNKDIIRRVPAQEGVSLSVPAHPGGLGESHPCWSDIYERNRIGGVSLSCGFIHHNLSALANS